MRVPDYLWSAVLCAALISLVYVSVSGKSLDEKDTEAKVPKVFDYGKYVEKFKKSYGPLETLHRAKLFFGRTMKIFQHNVLYARKKVTYFLTQNIFTDMTASEFRHIHANKEPELGPVKEALTNPDLPADKLSSVRRLKGEADDEGFSQASLEDLGKNAKFDAKKQKVKPILSFLDNQNVEDMKVALQQIKEMPDLDMTKVDELIDLKSIEGNLRQIESWADQEQEVNQHDREQVKYKPVVKPTNKNYEPQVVTSYAAHEEEPKETINYAKFLMGDPDFALNIAPYPHPGNGRKEEVEEADEKDDSIMSKFFGSVKRVASFIFNEDDLYDDLEDAGDVKEGAQEEAQKEEVVAPVESVKYNIDWRLTGCISPIQDQKMNCDSCYAFSVLGLMEYYHCRQTKLLTSFSAQYIVDCGPKVNLNGCRSSKVSNVGYFIKQYGLELNAKYPYNAQENTCPYNFDDPSDEEKSGYMRPRISHWQNFPDMASWYKWLPKSPLIVGINMPGDFLGYGGGVHDGLDCVNDMTHAMLLVGSGTQDGREFWLLKNSFSEAWGEAGYFKLAKSAPLRCFNAAIVARAKFLQS